MSARDATHPASVDDPSPSIGDPSVVLRSVGGMPGEWHIREPAAQALRELTHLLRSRGRWRDVPMTADVITLRCTDILGSVGLLPDQIEALAAAGTVEVGLRPTQPVACAFPWEFVISEVTRPYRLAAGRQVLVVRHLRTATDPPPPQPTNIVIVESAPGELGEWYSFESERRVVRASVDLPSGDPVVNPDPDELRARIVHDKPGIVHFTGVDSLQAAQLLKRTSYADSPGVFLRKGDDDGVPVAFAEVASLVTAAAQKPALVSFNFYNSSLLAMLAVEEGAHAAIGFQDEIDDTIAELFFAAFYSEWRRNQWRLFDAYRQGWLRISSAYGLQLRGTGITLWCRAGCSMAPQGMTRTPPADTVPPTPTPRRRKPPASGAPAPSPPPPPAPRADIGTAISVEYDAPERINYSQLHNNHPLFSKFAIRRELPGEYGGIRVDVALHTGIEKATYQASFKLDDGHPLIDLAKKDSKDAIRVSLTSELARSLAESVYTSIFVHVRRGEETIRRQTHRVELLPIDEWQDDPLNQRWLPSFVLPRDPAVRAIVDAAQRYLIALADDSTAGFDGYQSFEERGGSLDEKARGVDVQVQALWWGIISEFNLSYINPPPTFSEHSQRLRTPSDIINTKRGTCIDLTLLFAACLEYIDIRPVIFLLRGHAFPGWVRSESSHQRIREQFAASSDGIERPTEPAEQQVGWMLPVNRYSEVLRLVQNGDVVPLETVALTQRSGFQSAIEEGMQNLRSRREFESLFDVRLARDARVTPLPIGTVRT